MSFTAFMHLIYVVSCKLPGSTIKGLYTKRDESMADRFKAGKGQNSFFWQELSKAFKVLEADFVSFDKDGDNYVDYVESKSCIRVLSFRRMCSQL